MQNIILFRFIFILFIFSFTQCANSSEQKKTPISPEKEKQNELFREVMEIHDDIMPKTSDINRAKRELKAYLKDHPDLDQATQDTLQNVIAELTRAEDAMMDWMQGIRNPADSIPHQDAMKYLLNEKKEIQKVRTLMLKSLEKGKKTIEDRRTRGQEDQTTRQPEDRKTR